jgi:tetratricopeptide (TPR) repeat protein
LRLIALQPRDVTYNYKYGTCLLYNSNNKQEAIRYLSFATNDPSIAPEAFYFLGKALHLNYQFNEAIKHYTTYLQKSPKGVKFAEAERGIQMCQNGKRLMTTISDIIVTDKKEITIDKFFRIYDLKDIGGNLLVTAEFQTKLDKKNNHIPLIHFPQNPSVIYYSSYGENGTNGKDIYVPLSFISSRLSTLIRLY